MSSWGLSSIASIALARGAFCLAFAGPLFRLGNFDENVLFGTCSTKMSTKNRRKNRYVSLSLQGPKGVI